MSSFVNIVLRKYRKYRTVFLDYSYAYAFLYFFQAYVKLLLFF